MVDNFNSNGGIPRPKQPKDLKRKVPPFGGVNPEKAFKQAEQILDNLKHEYTNKLGEDIDNLERLTIAFKKDQDVKHLEAVYNLVHNMRGQGATFDYPLVSEIGSSFCKYASSRKDKNVFSFVLIIQHLEALKVVYRMKMRGAGDKVTQTVVVALKQAVAMELEKEKTNS